MSISSESSGSHRPSSMSGSVVTTVSDVSLGAADSTCTGPFVVYCDTCSKPLTRDCLTSLDHCSHQFKTIEEVCLDKMDKMKQQLEKLTASDQSNSHQRVESQEQLLESEFQRLQESLTAQYKELEDLLVHNMEQTFSVMDALRQGEKKLVYDQTQEGDKYKQQANNILKEIEILKEQVSSDSKCTCFKEIEDYQNRIDKINAFYSGVVQNTNYDRTRCEALDKSVQRIYGKISEILPRPWQFYEIITFNPDNTDRSLIISSNGTQVSRCSQQKSPKYTYQTETTLVHILAEQSWKNGQHYWEVDVTNCRTWAVGVVELASGNQLPKKAAFRHLGRDKRSWMLESEDGELAVIHNDHLDIVKEQDVKRLGVFLDLTKDKHRLTFYSVGSNVPLHTFYPQFKKRVFPAFSLSSTADEVQSLVLCNLNLKQSIELDSGVDMSSGSSSPRSSPVSLNTSGYLSDSDIFRSIAPSMGPEMTTSL